VRRVCVYVYVEVPARFRVYKEALRCAYRVCGMVIAVGKMAATDTIKSQIFYSKSIKNYTKCQIFFT